MPNDAQLRTPRQRREAAEAAEEVAMESPRGGGCGSGGSGAGGGPYSPRYKMTLQKSALVQVMMSPRAKPAAAAGAGAGAGVGVLRVNPQGVPALAFGTAAEAGAAAVRAKVRIYLRNTAVDLGPYHQDPAVLLHEASSHLLFILLFFPRSITRIPLLTQEQNRARSTAWCRWTSKRAARSCRRG